MDLDAFNDRRTRLNERLADADEFFAAFGRLDDGAYAEGVLPEQTKELIGIALSVAARCDECVAYHVQRARQRGVTSAEAVEAIKLGVIAAGSLSYPTARVAMQLIDDVMRS